MLPADVSWSEGGALARPRPVLPPVVVDDQVESVAGLLRAGATARVVPQVCTQPDTVRARASMSDCNGASYRTWPVA